MMLRALPSRSDTRMSRFLWVPPPLNAVTRDPGWTRLGGYGDSAAEMGLSIAVGAALAVASALGWYALLPDALAIVGRPALLSIVAVFVTAIWIHELVHLLAMPSQGRRDAIIGVWAQAGSAYVQYQKPLGRDRFALLTLAPFALLSALPLLLVAFGVDLPAWVAWAGIVNAFASGADITAIAQMGRQTPPNARVIESGHALYWRVA
jgi:hypothetical protein